LKTIIDANLQELKLKKSNPPWKSKDYVISFRSWL